jgi:hypothetical protein
MSAGLRLCWFCVRLAAIALGIYGGIRFFDRAS